MTSTFTIRIFIVGTVLHDSKIAGCISLIDNAQLYQGSKKTPNGDSVPMISMFFGFGFV